jgi:hypothetical protein
VIIRSKGSFPGVAEVADAWYLAGGASMPVAAYQPIGAASLAASYVNLANPGTNDAAPGVAPTWNATNGWIHAGSEWLTTGVVPAQGYSMIVRFSSFSLSSAYLGGVIKTNAHFAMSPNPDASDRQVFWYGDVARYTGSDVAGGVMALTADDGYMDGVAAGLTMGNFAATSAAIFVGAYNNGSGAATSRATVNIQAVAIYSSTLTASQVAALTAAMAAL